jgi:hypothetical protein
LHFATVFDFLQLILKILDFIGLCLLFFSIESGRSLGNQKKFLGGLLVVDLVVMVHFLDLFVTNYYVVHDYPLAILRDIGFHFFPLLQIEYFLQHLFFILFLEPQHLVIEIIFFPFLDNTG